MLQVLFGCHCFCGWQVNTVGNASIFHKRMMQHNNNPRPNVALNTMLLKTGNPASREAASHGPSRHRSPFPDPKPGASQGMKITPSFRIVTDKLIVEARQRSTGRYDTAGYNRDESGVNSSSINTSSPSQTPNSNLVSAMIMLRFSACAAAKVSGVRLGTYFQIGSSGP